MTSIVRLGTAGWSIASANASLFPAGESQLHRYAGRFNAAEINSSFYRPHRPATYERWAQVTPPDFRFAAKLPRTITHERRMVECGDLVDRFASEIAGLGDKLGVILAQLPPSLAFDPAMADAFFPTLTSRLTVPAVCEPRHPSWFTPEADALLIRHHIARVAADPARAPGADLPGGWDGLAYWRWHGSPRVYFSAYGAERLEPLAEQIEARPDRSCWVFFDNTASSSAVRDAAILADLLS